MEKKALIAGIALTLLGLGGRLIPRVVTGISLMSIAQAVGILLILFVIFRKRAEIGTWSRRRPGGRSIAALVGVLLLLLMAELGGAIAREIEAGRLYARIEGDLERKDEDAAEALATHLANVEDAQLRMRIISKIEKLGVRSRRVSGTLREVLRTEEDEGVREAAAEALGIVLPRVEILSAILELPQLAPEMRAHFIGFLGKRTGQKFGEDVTRWREWFTSTWAGAEGDEAYALALDAYRSTAGVSETRDACLLRLSNGEGVSGAKILALLDDENRVLRLAAARAAASKGDSALAGSLVNRLKVEADADAATGMAKALVALDPAGATPALVDVVRTSKSEAARAAASNELAHLLGGPPTTDPAELLFRMRAKLEPGAPRRAALDDIVRLASDSDTAKSHLLALVRNRDEDARDRRTALRGILTAEGDLLTNDELVALMEDSPDIEFTQTVRGELRRRTGKDGGRDAAEWRKIIGED